MNQPQTPFDIHGIECGSGWEKYYAPIIARCLRERIYIMQVKEKFGGLRIYVQSPPQDLEREIDFAESASFHVCEVCGVKGELRRRRGWLKTLCDGHATDMQFEDIPEAA